MGQKEEDVISFEMIIKFYYKDCEVILKKLNNILDISVINITPNGFIAEINKTFICGKNYKHFLEYLDTVIDFVEEIYQEIKRKESNFNNNTFISNN